MTFNVSKIHETHLWMGFMHAMLNIKAFWLLFVIHLFTRTTNWQNGLYRCVCFCVAHSIFSGLSTKNEPNWKKKKNYSNEIPYKLSTNIQRNCKAKNNTHKKKTTTTNYRVNCDNMQHTTKSHPVIIMNTWTEQVTHHQSNNRSAFRIKSLLLILFAISLMIQFDRFP